MRYSVLAIGLFAAIAFGPSELVRANEAAEEVIGLAVPAPIMVTPELIQAQYAYKLAKLRLHQYRFVELPRQRQLVNNQISLRESEIRVLKRRLRDYRSFLLVGRYSPVRSAAELDRLALQAAEQELKLLRNERINLMRYSGQHARLYQLEVMRTAAQLR